MSKLIVITGATGKQGGSVVNAFLRDPSFKIRAIARDPNSASALKLIDKGVEVVHGDIDDGQSLVQAFKGANYIYAMTGDISVLGASIMARGNTPSIPEEAYRMERRSGKNIVDAANSTIDSLELFIFSSLSAAKRLSQGEYKHIYHFDAKAETVEYLQTTYPILAGKTAALELGMFATNWRQPNPLRPTKQPDGRFRIFMPCSADTPIPFIDPNHDPATFVKALVSQSLSTEALEQNQPMVRKYAGYGKMTTFTEWVDLLNAHLPVSVYFEETSVEEWSKYFTVIPGIGMEVAEMWKYCETIGYFGGEAGGTIPITDLKLGEPAVSMKEFVAKEDWSLLFQE